MQVVLHIGTDKTGSTSIQAHLALNRSWFAARSVYIPATGFGSDNGHATLLRKLDGDQLQALAQELHLAERDGHDTALLSWEGMHTYSASQVRRLSSALSGYHVRVLVYLREQAELLQSGHLQNLKSRTNPYLMHVFEEPRSLLEKMRSRRIRAHPGRNYHQLLRKWERNIPGVAITACIFDRQVLRGGDVVADFIHQLGLDPGIEFHTVPDQGNPSLDVECGMMVEAWQSESRGAEDIARLSDIAQSLLSLKGGGSKFFLSRQTVESIRAFYRPHNVELAPQFMGVDSDPFSNANPCWREESLSAIAARVESLSRKVAQIDETPTVTTALQGERIAAVVDRCNGWSDTVAWGAWSNGPVSQLRFRLSHRKFRGDSGALCVVLTGRYYGENSTSRVTVNAIEFGEQCLDSTHAGLLLPITQLLPYETLDIALRHSHPVSPRQLVGENDDRPIAFGLQRISCTTISSAEALKFTGGGEHQSSDPLAGQRCE